MKNQKGIVVLPFIAITAGAAVISYFTLLGVQKLMEPSAKKKPIRVEVVEDNHPWHWDPISYE